MEKSTQAGLLAEMSDHFAVRNQFRKKLKRAERAQRAGQLDEAQAIYIGYLKHAPQDPEICFNMGVLCQSKGTHAGRLEAIEWYHRAIASPSIDLLLKSDAMNNIGILMEKIDRPDKAQLCYFYALQFHPENSAARLNYANGLRFVGEYVEADRQYAEVLKLDPDSPELALNAGMLALLLGDLKRGFELYERRFDVKEFPTKRFISERPLWRGEDLNGKTILLTEEQGFGDTFQFIRYARELKKLGATVWFYGNSMLMEIMQHVEGVDHAFDRAESEEYDFHCPLMSLPHRRNTTLETIPVGDPYIKPANHRNDTGKRRIGIIWAGSPKHGKDKWRSIEPESFQPIIDSQPDAEFLSLQVGPRAHECSRLRGVTDIAPTVTGWMDTANIIATLDLIICVDTGCAHLAGAIGVPVWLLIPHSPDFRWLLEREDSPWYPKARLFRQPASDDWQTPINRIIAELAK